MTRRTKKQETISDQSRVFPVALPLFENLADAFGVRFRILDPKRQSAVEFKFVKCRGDLRIVSNEDFVDIVQKGDLLDCLTPISSSSSVEFTCNEGSVYFYYDLSYSVPLLSEFKLMRKEKSN